MISGMSMLFLVLLCDDRSYRTETCSIHFTNLNVNVNVDHSTNIGEVVFTLMNGNDAQIIEMETSASNTHGLNPSNDHEVIVTACVFWIGSELLYFKISGDSTWCGSLNMISSPAIPQFTNPTEIIKIGPISPFDIVDVVQVTFANDQCADFECPSVTCSNDASQNFIYFVGTQTIRIHNLSIQYGVTYTIEITCRDTKHSSGTATQTVTVVFYETAPSTTTTTTTTITISAAPSTASSNTSPTTTTITAITTTTTPTHTTVPTTPMTTPRTSMTTPTTTMTTPTTSTTMPITTLITHTNTISTPTTTTTIPTTTVINTSTALTSFTTTVPISTSTSATLTAISATPNSQQISSTDVLAAGIKISDPEITNVTAIATGAAIGGVGLLGLIAFSLYWKFAATKRISTRAGRKPDERKTNEEQDGVVGQKDQRPV